MIDMLGTFDMTGYYGDTSRPDLLHAAGIEVAKVIVSRARGNTVRLSRT